MSDHVHLDPQLAVWTQNGRTQHFVPSITVHVGQASAIVSAGNEVVALPERLILPRLQRLNGISSKVPAHTVALGIGCLHQQIAIALPAKVGDDDMLPALSPCRWLQSCGPQLLSIVTPEYMEGALSIEEDNLGLPIPIDIARLNARTVVPRQAVLLGLSAHANIDIPGPQPLAICSVGANIARRRDQEFTVAVIVDICGDQAAGTILRRGDLQGNNRFSGREFLARCHIPHEQHCGKYK
ncbi:MAG: hypothetical protein N2A40_04600 [Desulfobulbaceae bacterium]